MKDHKEAVNNIMENIKNEMLWRLENEYKRGYEDGKEQQDKLWAGERYRQELTAKGYYRGLEDAWKTALQIANMTMDECKEIFGDCSYFSLVAYNYTADQAMKKIMDYEERQTEEIKVGDEVTIRDIKGTIINIDGYGLAQIMCVDGFVCFRVEDLTKTGRHFPQIAEVLEQMRKESE